MKGDIVKKLATWVILFMTAAVLVSACAPATTIQPEQIVVNMPFPEAYAIVSKTISTQPYPSNKGGWVVVNSDQVGGIILAEMNYTVYNFWSGVTTAYVERVSVAFTAMRDDQTGINVSRSSGDEARKLAEAIVRDLTN